MSKKSIRFFNDREVRAVWDDDHNKWWFSATDIVRAINDEDDYTKCRNYWKYLKGKMAKEGIELVSVTNQFKFQAPDGKQRAADALDADCVQTLAKNYPNNRARNFLDWFVYSDNSIDGQSKILYFLARHDGFVSYAVAHMNGSSGRQRVSGSDIANYEMPEITNETLDFVSDKLHGIMEVIKNNSLESRRLASLRDTLLPRLMSGELKVNEIENLV